MSNKNRAARLSDFRQGITVWEVIYDEVRPRYVMSRPFRCKVGGSPLGIAVDMRSAYFYDSVDHEFLSDAGIHGCTYDGRPPRFYLSRGAAYRALPIMLAYQEELKARRREDPMWSDDTLVIDDLDYLDYEEPSQEELHEKFMRRRNRNGSYTAPIHELVFKHGTDHKEITFQFGTSLWVGEAIDSTRIRVDYIYFEDGTIEPTRMHLLMHKGQWCNTENCPDAWRCAQSASPSQFKRITADLQPMLPEWQEALSRLVVTSDAPSMESTY